MSHFREPAVPMKNNLRQRKGVDITFSLFIMTKIELQLENKLWILLSPMTTTGCTQKTNYSCHILRFGETTLKLS